MAYEFNGTNQFLSVASAPATTAPLTMALWFRKNSTSTKNGLFIRNSSETANTFGIYFTTVIRGYAQQAVPSATSDIVATANYSTATWTHAAFVIESATSRTIYQNAANSASSTASIAPAGLNAMQIASFSGATNFDGQMAEVGVWSAALTQQEIESLSRGYTCDKVRPQSLVFYAPLVRDLIDVKGGLTITNNNTATVAAHPRVYA